MKSFACVALALMLGGAPVLAAPGECRHIQSRKERNACYEQQSLNAKSKRASTTSDNTKMIDAVDRMKLEDDQLTKRLQGICRGC